MNSKGKDMWAKGPIIVVDDDPDEHFFYRRTFEKLKIENEVLFFDNGKAALDFLKEPGVNPFLILCDINMPVMNGIQFREEICKNTILSKKNTPFIFLSASAQLGDVRRASELYTHGFFEKATTLDKHESLLRKIIEYWRDCRYTEC